MNPRHFCRERAFHKTLLLTYSFDPIFFEQIILPDLWAGRSGDILAIGDRAQVLAATTARTGQLWHLGKHYVLAPARHEGAFHPKVILRLGAREGAVLIGSGNLTNSGWAGNQEIGTSWRIGPDHADQGAWLDGFLVEVMRWCSSDLERDTIARMRDTPWLSLAHESASSSDLIFSRRHMTLASLLVERWAGRRFDEVKILTGSTDEAGAFLRWAHTALGVRRATIALTPARASFVPDRLADLPMDLRLVEAPPERPMHAKFYWFEGEQGAAAAMGSANCSAAAWLIPPDRGGNIETVVVYDDADSDAYGDVLKIFDRPPSLPEILLGRKHVAEPDVDPAKEPYRLHGVRWDRELGQMHVLLDPVPTPGSTVELLLGAKAFPMTQVQAALAWSCTAPDVLEEGTTFASVRITFDGRAFTTEPRWVDDLMALRIASQSARFLEPFKGLERATTSSEQRQMLEDLQEVAYALFNETAAFRDTTRHGSSDRQLEAVAPPVDPSDLVCRLEEGTESKLSMPDTRNETLSISGILRMLFDIGGDSEDAVAEVEHENGDGSEDVKELPRLPESREQSASDAHVQAPIVEARFRERLASQIGTFLSNMRSQEFADRCSATQMVQAAAFPLAVAVRGRRHGWVSPTLAERWIIEVVSVLFRGVGPRGIPLLKAVESRYVNNGQSEVFADVVGDGTLWIALVSLFAGSQWHGPGAFMEKAIALRELFESPVLTRSARPDRVKSLVGRVRVDEASHYLTDIAPTARTRLAELEAALVPIWNNEVNEQRERRITNREGDVLWRERVGWAICLEESVLQNEVPTRVRLRGHEMQVKAGFYVNVSEAALRYPEIGQKLDELCSLVA